MENVSDQTPASVESPSATDASSQFSESVLFVPLLARDGTSNVKACFITGVFLFGYLVVSVLFSLAFVVVVGKVVGWVSVKIS